MNRLQGKVAVISGAASGIGRQCALRFAEQGATVVLADRDAANGEVVSSEINAAGNGRAVFQQLDVTLAEQWTALAERCESDFGSFDVLVNGAGLFLSGIEHTPESETLDAWHSIQAVNIEGLMLGCKTAIAAMRESGGSVINISSVAGLKASVFATAYGLSKGAVRQYTKSVAAHCARKGYGVRCNSIHPGIINTPMGRVAMSTASGDLDVGMERYRKAIPLRAIGEPDDIAWAALYLASDESRYVTGLEMVVDGGVATL